MTRLRDLWFVLGVVVSAAMIGALVAGVQGCSGDTITSGTPTALDKECAAMRVQNWYMCQIVGTDGAVNSGAQPSVKRCVTFMLAARGAPSAERRVETVVLDPISFDAAFPRACEETILLETPNLQIIAERQKEATP